MHSLYMQIASLSNIAGKTKWLINHGFYIFSSVQNICPGTRVLKKKCPGNCMCTYVPDTWSPMCSLDVRICLGQIEPCSEIPNTSCPQKMRRRYKNWPPAFSNMQWPPPHPLYASAWFGQHATFTKEFQGNFLPRFKKGQLKISSSREMDVFIISCCFILSISCCHSVPTSSVKERALHIIKVQIHFSGENLPWIRK